MILYNIEYTDPSNETATVSSVTPMELSQFFDNISRLFKLEGMLEEQTGVSSGESPQEIRIVKIIDSQSNN